MSWGVCLARSRVWTTRLTAATFPGHASERWHTRRSHVVIRPSWRVTCWGEGNFPAARAYSLPIVETGAVSCLTRSSRRSE